MGTTRAWCVVGGSWHPCWSAGAAGCRRNNRRPCRHGRGTLRLPVGPGCCGAARACRHSVAQRSRWRRSSATHGAPTSRHVSRALRRRPRRRGRGKSPDQMPTRHDGRSRTSCDHGGRSRPTTLIHSANKVLSLSKASSMPRRISASPSGQDATRSSGTLRFTWISEEPPAASRTRSEPR